MHQNEIFEIIRKAKPELEKYNVQSIAVFGSVARQEEHEGSDLDILVDFSAVPSMFEFIRLKRYLEQITGRRVDLVTKDALHPELRDHILKDAQDVR